MPRNRPCIAVDAMGGDFGPEVIVPGAVKATRKGALDVLLVGVEDKIKEVLAVTDHNPKRVKIVHAPDVAGMSEKPSDILRRKKGSSIQVACRAVKEGQACGVVSAGNSGATMACGMFILGRIKGIERPALATFLPTAGKPSVLIDVGGNVDCKPYNLAQFGFMADVLARDVLGVEKPTVGLLNIGEEEGKGNSQVKEAYRLLKLTPLNFIGNVEGSDIYSGNVDVVVCDGFVGNVALKLSEGLSRTMAGLIKAELKKSIWSVLGSLMCNRAFSRFKKKVDYAEYGGAPILGLKGIAIVCHGSSNSRAVETAVDMAATFVRNRANDHLRAGLEAHKELSIFAKKALPVTRKQNTEP